MSSWSDLSSWIHANEPLVVSALIIAGLAGFYFQARATARGLRHFTVPRPVRLVVRPVPDEAIDMLRAHIAQQGGRASAAGEGIEAAFADADHAARAAFSIEREIAPRYGPFEQSILEPDGPAPTGPPVTAAVLMSGIARRALGDAPDLTVRTAAPGAPLPFEIKEGRDTPRFVRRALVSVVSAALCAAALLLLLG